MHDVLKRVEVMLEDYENKLSLLEKMGEIENILNTNDELKNQIMKILNR